MTDHPATDRTVTDRPVTDDSRTDAARGRPALPRWSLQARLIATVVTIVALMLAAIALGTGAILNGILRDNLTAQVATTAASVRWTPGATAAQVLDASRHDDGTLLVMTGSVALSGAYVDDDGRTRTLDEAQLGDVLRAGVDPGGWGWVDITGLGEYRLSMRAHPSGAFYVVGLPTSDLATTTGQILTTVTLLTVGGLLVLAAALAVVIRRSLRPLGAVVETATRVAEMPLAQGAVSIPERVPATSADERNEIGRVGAALNTLLAHVDSSLRTRQRNEERMRAFVADASHELRTPLASIRGYSELSLRALDHADAALARETTEQSLQRIQAQSVRMTGLVEDLLLLARLDEGAELVYGAVDLSALTVEAVADAQAAGGDHHWIVDVGERPVVVAGDGARLSQVLVNLLANARVHTPPGSTVRTRLTQDGRWAQLEVHDDGPGVDPSVADALFERFTRADGSRTRATGGAGLGLSIARAIVTAHGGTLGVDSVPGSTTFTVRLPARPADPAPGQ